MHPLNGARARCGSESKVIVECDDCRRQWLIVVHMRPGPITSRDDRRRRAGAGTPQG